MAGARSWPASMPRSRSAGSPAGVIGAVSRGASASTCACSSRSSAVVAAAVGLTWSRRFLGGDADAIGSAEPVFVRPPRAAARARWGWPSPACSSRARRPTGARVYLRDELGTARGNGGHRLHGVQRDDDARARCSAIGWSIASAPRPSCAPAGGSRRSASAWARSWPPRRSPRSRLRLPRRRDVGRRADRLPCRGARRPACSAGVGLAAVSSTGYLGFLVGPPMIGGLAELVGLPGALGVLVVLASASPSWRPPPAYARGGASVTREADGGGMTDDPVRPRRRAGRLARLDHARVALVGRRARRRGRGDRERSAGAAVRRGHRRAGAGPRRRGRVARDRPAPGRRRRGRQSPCPAPTSCSPAPTRWRS